MALFIDIPADVEQKLRDRTVNLDSEAKEAMLVELYRQDKLSHHELSQSLGLDQFEIDAVLKRHHVTEDLPTDEEHLAALFRLGVAGDK